VQQSEVDYEFYFDEARPLTLEFLSGFWSVWQLFALFTTTIQTTYFFAFLQFRQKIFVVIVPLLASLDLLIFEESRSEGFIAF